MAHDEYSPVCKCPPVSCWAIITNKQYYITMTGHTQSLTLLHGVQLSNTTLQTLVPQTWQRPTTSKLNVVDCLVQGLREAYQGTKVGLAHMSNVGWMPFLLPPVTHMGTSGS